MLGRSPGEGKGYLLEYSCLENFMNCIVHGVTKSWTRLSDFHFQQFSSVTQLCLFVTSRTAAHQASLSITNSRSFLKLMSIKLVMPSNHLTLCHPLLLSPSVFPSIRVFSNESVLRIRWPKYWSFSFSISPSDEYSGFPYSPAIARYLQCLFYIVLSFCWSIETIIWFPLLRTVKTLGLLQGPLEV